MSALGSSVINKSSKRLAPRAPPPRRRPVTEQAPVQAQAQVQALLPTPPVSQDASGTSPHGTSQNPADTPEAGTTPALEISTREASSRKRKRLDAHENTQLPETQDPTSNNSDTVTQSSAAPASQRKTRNQKHVNPVEDVSAPADRQLTETIEVAQTPEDYATGIDEETEPTNNARLRKKTTANKRVDLPSLAPVTRTSKRKAAGSANDTNGTLNKEQDQEHPLSDSNITKPSKRGPSRKRKSGPDPDTDPHANTEQSPGASDDQETPGIDSAAKQTRKRRRTPEGAEKHQLDPTATLMFDLTKDSKKGQKSKLEGEFQEIDWSEVVRLRKEAEARAREEYSAEPRRDLQTPNAPTAAADEPQGPRLKLVNGQIVLDSSSLVVDRHAAAIPDTDQPAIEERDITRRINSRTWLHDNRRDPEERQLYSGKSDPWNAQATERFYSALRMWGTDFFMISKMFPGRTRRHIKLKFTREERANPSRIRDALIGGSVPMDLDAYCAATGKTVDDYKDPAVLQEELKVEEEQQRLEIERQKEEQALAQRKKQEAAAAKAAAGKGKRNADKSGGTARSRKKKQDALGADNLVSSADIVESIES